MKTNKGQFKKGHIGLSGSGRKKGCVPWNKGLVRSDIGGSNHPFWKGGIDEGYAKKQALRRDNYTCREKGCGITDKEVLEVDHIISKAIRPDLVSSIDNLITLCANHHRKKTHRDRREGKYSNKIGLKLVNNK